MLCDPDFEDAVGVSDHVLELTRSAYMNRDVDAFCARFQLPQIIGTFDGDRTVGSTDELSAIFWAMRRHYDSLGVIDLNRRTIAAHFLDDGRVEQTFSTQLVLPGFAQSDEIVVHGYLALEDGLWKVAGSRYATDMTPVTRALSAR